MTEEVGGKPGEEGAQNARVEDVMCQMMATIKAACVLAKDVAGSLGDIHQGDIPGIPVVGRHKIRVFLLLKLYLNDSSYPINFELSVLNLY